MKETILICSFILGIVFISEAQVTSTNFLIEYNDTTGLYDCKIVIIEGEVTTYPQRIQFNSQYTIVVPTGTELSIDSLHNPKEANQFYTGTIPCLWEFGPKEYSPPTQPQNDFHSISPNLSPASAYNDLIPGDTITLFSVSADVDPCDNAIRLFRNDTDPTSAEMPGGGDFSNGFTLGGPPPWGGAQLYSGNLTTIYESNSIATDDELSICFGDCVELQPSIFCLEEPFKYEWSTGDTTEIIDVCPTEPTDYFLLVKDTTGLLLDSLTVHVGIDLIIDNENNTVCPGGTITLESCLVDGIWLAASANPSPTTFSEQSGGIVEVTFPESASGVYSFIFSNEELEDTISVTVIPKPTVQINNVLICVGGTTEVVSNQEGTWVSNNPAIATVHPTTGLVYGHNQGEVTFTFTSTISECSNTTGFVLVAYSNNAEFTGPDKICSMATTTVSPTSGGTWTSADNTIATVSNDGIVTGIYDGTTSLTFTSSNGCHSNPLYITVQAPTTELTGPNKICIGSTTTMEPSMGGYWASSDPGIATIDNFGIITGIAAGEATFNFTNATTLCVSEPTESVYVGESSNVAIQGLELCIEETTLLISDTNGTWSSNNPSVATTNYFTGEVTAINAGTVGFTFTNEFGCVSSIPNNLIVYPKPEVQLLGSEVICVGSTTVVSPNSGGIWTSSNAVILTIDNIGNITGITEGIATVIHYSSATGCISDPIEITVLGSTTPLPVSSNGPLCEGDYLELYTDSFTEATYQWTGPDGNIISNQQNPTLQNVTSNESGVYCLVVSIDGCESQEICTDVLIFPTPKTPITSNYGPICEGEGLELYTNEVAGATYTWTGPNGFTSNQQNPTIAEATPSESGTYCVVVTVNGCDSDPGCTDVVIKPTPATPTASYYGGICEGEDLELSSGFVSGATYSWSGPNGFSSTLQNPTISSASPADEGFYCVVVVVEGCTSQEACTEVGSDCPCPIVENTIIQPDLNEFCEESEVVTILGSYALPAGGTYTWEYSSNGGGFVQVNGSNGQKDYTTNILPAGEHKFRRIYTIDNPLPCEEISNIVDVIVIPSPPTPQATNNGPICEGESVELITNAVAGATYAWTGPSGFTSSDQNPTLFSVTSDLFGVYSVIVSVDGCESSSGSTEVKKLNCIEPVVSCEDISSDDIMCDYNDLSNISGTLSTQNSDGNQPLGELCNDGDEAQNIAWLGFVALAGDYEIVVNTTNCTPYLGGEVGVQVGIYSDCDFTDQTKIFCESMLQTENQIRVSSDILNLGQTYFLYIDGFDASVCDFSIDVEGFYDNTYCTDLSKVTGVAYIDDNENGIYEIGETLLRNALISLTPGNFSVLTNNEGKYIINTPKGEATLTARMNEGHWINKELTIEDVTIFDTCVEGIDFGFIPNLYYQEANISVVNTVTRCDWETRFYFTVENTGTIDLDASFEFDFDAKASYFSTNLIGLQVNGDVASGNLGVLKPFEIREYWIKLKMPSGSTVLPMLDFKTTLYNGAGMKMDEYEHSEQLRCSYDPNDKREFPNREGEANLTLMDEDIEYTIRFQNNGNDTAFLVKIIDPLDPNIDPRSIRVINSSHTVETCIENDNLIFIFENINLVDSMTNYDGSQGFVSFRCDTKEGRAENTIVHNTADIIFDTNVPIITNETINTLVRELCSNVTHEIDIDICDGEDYNGYEESGTYTEFYPLDYGCDSMVIINLEVQGITYSSQNIDICEGEPLNVNGNEYVLNESQILRDTIMNEGGCISNIFIFDVLVNPVLWIEIDTAICEGLDYNGLVESGVYTIESFDTETGCDIITTIDLEVLPMSDPACIVGIDDLVNSEIKIYPIPARDVFFIEGKGGIDAVSIFSMDYQQLKEITFKNNGQKQQISTEDLSIGLYILAVKTADVIIYKKLIVE